MASKAPEALFPALPEDPEARVEHLRGLDDDALAALLTEHNVAADLIDAEDADFTKGLDGEDILAQYNIGLAQMEAIVGVQKEREEEAQRYVDEKADLANRRKALLGAEPADEVDDETAKEIEAAAEKAENDDELAEKDGETEDELKAEEPEPKTELKAAEPVQLRVRRRAPATPADRSRGHNGAVLTASAAAEGARPGQVVSSPLDYGELVSKTAQRHGRVSKHEHGREERILIASAAQPFPDDRVLHKSDWGANQDKIAAVVPGAIPGVAGLPLDSEVLVASGGLCAPLEPLYTMPNFATQARPVRDALPSFRAERGGVNVPTATYIGDITTAITVIEESEDALGGTFATKSCQDLTCPAYTETAVTIVSHCREYGNLLAMTWPEKVAHENALTMAAHSRAAETYLLDRIKALSLNVTNGAETLGALIYLVDAIVKARFGIIGRLRMDEDSRFRALLPFWVPEMLALDTVQSSDGTRFTSKAQLIAYLRDRGIEPSFYLDSPSSGTTQLPDSAQTAAAIDPLPDNVQWALFPEGAFIHLDSGVLELGLVRDSTLNSTNDHQLFGESFENVARIAPQQATYWITSDLCANGMLAPAGTARTCD